MPDQTILLIDFDPRSIEDALRFLTEAGYGVEVANDGIAGMEAFERIQPDLVLIEPMVPRKHGFEVCRDIKGSPRGQNTPVLITTGFYCGKKHHVQAKQLYGCDDYLEKPVDGVALVSTCRRLLEGGSEPENAATFEEPSGEDRIPALDDLTEEEIVTHLDALIVEQPAPQTPAGPAETVDAAELFPDIEKAQPAPKAAPEEPKPLPAPALEAEPQRSRLARWALPALLLAIAVGAGSYFVFNMAGEGEIAVPPAGETIAAARPAPVEASVQPQEPQVAAQAEVVDGPPAIAEEVPEEVPPEVAPAEPPPPAKAVVPKQIKAFIEPAITIDTSPLPESAGVGLSVGTLPETGQTLAEPEPPKFLRGDLIDIAEADSPPVSISKSMPRYHPMARQMRQQGTVVLRLLIDVEGRVERVETVSSDAGRMLEATAIEKAKSWTYHPAVKDGVEVRVWKIEQVVFTLDAH